MLPEAIMSSFPTAPEKIAQGTLTKRGEGKLVLNLDNTGWNGDISVQQGELVAQVANSLGSGAITVTDGVLTLATADVQPEWA